MDTPRYLCSELVLLHLGERRITVNLEEICATGAVIEAEEELPSGAPVELQCRDVAFSGRLSAVERHEFGYRAEVTFSPETSWNPERFQPEHLLDPSALHSKRRSSS